MMLMLPNAKVATFTKFSMGGHRNLGMPLCVMFADRNIYDITWRNEVLHETPISVNNTARSVIGPKLITCSK